MADGGRTVRGFPKGDPVGTQCSGDLDVSWEILVVGWPAMGALAGDVSWEIWWDHAFFANQPWTWGFL